ncbi:MAG: ABC transporter ATP-binding protein/permease [Ignavibacteria bacterium]|nr:ABC transporter ATP-binding protein/permease [Ignavibacteria bacterium]
MKLLLRYLREYRWLVFLTLLLASVNQIFSLLDPIILRFIIDDYATKFDKYTSSEFFKGVGFLLLIGIAAAFISRLARNFQDYYISLITQKLGAKIYADGIRHSLELPFEKFEDKRSGETLEILQKARTDVEKLITVSVNILFTTLVGIIFVTVYSFTIHWIIFPIYVLTTPLIAWVSSQLSKRIKRIQKNIVNETTSLAGATTESLRNIELVKSLGLAGQEINRLNSTTDKILSLELRKVKYVRTLSFIQGTLVNFLRTSILFVMMYLIFSKVITPGEFFSLYVYSFFIFGPLQELGNVINIYRETEVSLNNFKGIICSPPERKPENPVNIGDIHTLEFLNVSFKHQSGKSRALDNISFKTSLGETIAFVGPSGSGKTTLVKLLAGLYRPVEGNIFYNGIKESDIDFDVLRKQIGFVTQDTQLFAGTIKENLLFVNPDASDEEIMDALNKAACGSLLQRAENGIDTMIGEGGIKVSGGEKQRLSIARALLRKPRLLIFDEATSSLDSLTEEEIEKTIREISSKSEHITILIAHRLSTIMHSDVIYVLERGKIVERGTHDELLEMKGLYYAMWRQQIGERINFNGRDVSQEHEEEFKYS